MTSDPVGTSPPDAERRSGADPGRREVGSVIPPLLTLALGVTVIVVSTSLPPGGLSADPGPGALPRMVGIALVGLSIFLLWKREPHERLPRGEGAIRLVLTLVLTLGYILTIRPLGFLTATSVFLAALMVVIGLRRPLAIIGLSLILSAGVYGLFRYGLEVPLPATRIGSVTL